MSIRRLTLPSIPAFPTLVGQAKVISVSGSDSEAVAVAIAQAKPGDTEAWERRKTSPELLKRTRYLWLRDPENLTAKQRARLGYAYCMEEQGYGNHATRMDQDRSGLVVCADGASARRGEG
jgi:hypothetical protein